MIWLFYWVWLPHFAVYLTRFWWFLRKYPILERQISGCEWEKYESSIGTKISKTLRQVGGQKSDLVTDLKGTFGYLLKVICYHAALCPLFACSERTPISFPYDKRWVCIVVRLILYISSFISLKLLWNDAIQNDHEIISQIISRNRVH